MSEVFDYSMSFSRNIGWITKAEQQVLRNKRIAIAGMGGVGGSHLLTLTRLGVGCFNIADFDVFEPINFNRQAGATVSQLHKPKVDMLAKMALDINPELEINRFPKGVTLENMEEFFKDVDIYIDGLDFFVFDIRQAVFKFCHEHHIPAVTAAPLGMGTALLNFLPDKMSFEDYFGFGDNSPNEKGIRFLIGLAPAGIHRPALVDPNTLDLKNHKGPSTAMGCDLCAGAAASQALKILLNRGPVKAAPHGFQFDAYSNKIVHTWRPGGHKNPLQKKSLAIARKHFLSNTDSMQENNQPKTVIEKIIDVARWAPSGDNTQPWRFEIIGDDHFVVHGNDTREDCVYDLHGHPSQIAIGALLENIDIAASGHGLEINIDRRQDMPDTNPTFDIKLIKSEKNREKDPLLSFIPIRSVQRRSMSKLSLTAEQKRKLEESVGDGFKIVWLETEAQRRQAAILMYKNAKIRLTIPEAYHVHKDIIDWENDYSVDKVPAKAIGLDPLTTKLMRLTMRSWSIIKFFNTFMAGSVLPRLQMDLLPGFNCAAHFAIIADNKPETMDDYIAGGRAMQRFWLTATQLGLQLQPEMTPLIFSSYIREKIEFTKEAAANSLAVKLASSLGLLIGEENSINSVFLGRIGYGNELKSRSIRKSWENLIRSK